MVKKLMDGNTATSYGVKLSRVDVIAVYPITPQTEMATFIGDLVTKGEMKAKYIRTESEHASMSICAGASAAGARAFTASASQGIVYMEEPIWMVAGLRLPVVMAVVNRVIAWPGGLEPDHQDSLQQRDTGWIQLYCENSQEVLDTCIQAYKIGEDERVYLPVIFAFDGYYVSHTAIPVEVPDQEEVDDFLPPYKHKYQYLDVNDPMRLGRHPGPPSLTGMETKYQMEKAMENAKKVIAEVDEEYSKKFSRRTGGLIEKYRCEDARAILITMGSMTGTAREVIDEMRGEGKPIGLVKLRAFRPFPTEEIQNLAKNVEAIGFVDRNISHGSAGGGIGCSETARALYSMKDRPHLIGFIAGLYGRDVTPKHIRYMAERVLRAYEKNRVEKEVEWIGLRE